jgi:serine/threonine protein phosphatase PrpC
MKVADTGDASRAELMLEASWQGLKRFSKASKPALSLQRQKLRKWGSKDDYAMTDRTHIMLATTSRDSSDSKRNTAGQPVISPAFVPQLTLLQALKARGRHLLPSCCLRPHCDDDKQTCLPLDLQQQLQEASYTSYATDCAVQCEVFLPQDSQKPAATASSAAGVFSAQNSTVCSAPAAAFPCGPALNQYSSSSSSTAQAPSCAPAVPSDIASLLAAVPRATFGSKSVQNNRRYTEDREIAISLTGHPAFGFAKSAVLCAVFDGHGGDETAQYLATHMVEHIVSQGAAALQEEPDSALARAINCAEREVQSAWVPGAGHASGSTLCLCLMIDDKLHIAHVGDSRAVLAQSGKAVPLTDDHKPSSPAEAERIHAADPGATITADGYLYCELGVSRGLGSAHLKADPSKRAYVATPDVTSMQLGSGDDFVVLATDGLWDRVGSQDAVATASRSLAEHNDAAAASHALVERAQKLGSDDNVSVIVLLLHGRGIVLPKSNSRLFARRPVAAAAGPAVHGEGACASEAADNERVSGGGVACPSA